MTALLLMVGALLVLAAIAWQWGQLAEDIAEHGWRNDQ